MIFLVFGIASVAVGLLAAVLAPGTALAAVYCVFAFETLMQAKNHFFALHSSVINYSSAIIVMVALASAWLRGSVSLRRVTSLEYAMLAFYLLMIGSYAWAYSRPWWDSTIRYSAPYTLVYLFCIPFVFARLKDFDYGIKATIVFGALIISLLLFTTPMHQWGRSFNIEEGVLNQYGQIERGGSPLAVAGLAGGIALMAILASWKRGKLLWLVARPLIVAVACATIIQTDTRGQLLALVMTACIMPVFRWPKLDAKLIIGVPIVLCLLALGIYWGASFSTYQARWRPELMLSDFSSTRIVFCKQLLTEWLHHSPWHIMFGLGAGASWEILGSYPHVVAVQILGELGIVGFGIFLMILGLTVRSFLVSLKLAKNNELARAVICCLFAAFIFRFALSFKEGGLEYVYTLFLFPVLLARLHATLVRSSEQTTARGSVAYPSAELARPAELATY